MAAVAAGKLSTKAERVEDRLGRPIPPDKKRCTAKTKAGKRCTSVRIEGELCLAHSPREVQQKRGFGGPQEGAGRPGIPRFGEQLHEKIAAAVNERLDDIIGNLMEMASEGKKHVVVGNGPSAHVEEVPDKTLQLRAIDVVFDRLVGKPHQSTEITGADGEDLIPDVPHTSERMEDVAKIAAATGYFRDLRNGKN